MQRASRPGAAAFEQSHLIASFSGPLGTRAPLTRQEKKRSDLRAARGQPGPEALPRPPVPAPSRAPFFTGSPHILGRDPPRPLPLMSPPAAACSQGDVCDPQPSSPISKRQSTHPSEVPCPLLWALRVLFGTSEMLINSSCFLAILEIVTSRATHGNLQPWII